MFNDRRDRDFDPSPNREAMPAVDGDNCVVTARPGLPVSAVLVGQLIDIAASYDSIGDEYHSEINFRSPKDEMVEITAMEVHFAGEKASYPIPERGLRELFNALYGKDMLVFTEKVYLGNGRPVEALRVLPGRNEFNEPLFKPSAVEAVARTLADFQLIDPGHVDPIVTTLTLRMIREAAHRMLIRHEGSLREAKILRNEVGRNEGDSLFENRNIYGHSRRGNLEDRISVLEEDFARFTGEMRHYVNPSEIHQVFRAVSEMRSLEDLEPRDRMILKKFCEEPPPGCQRVAMGARLSLMGARFGRQFGEWIGALPD